MTYAGAEMLVEINRGDLKKLCLAELHKGGHRSITFVWPGKKGGFRKG